MSDRAIRYATAAGHRLKGSFDDPRDLGERALRLRPEFFGEPPAQRSLGSLLAQLGEWRTVGRRQITFTAFAGNHSRPAAVNNACDPHQFIDFRQGIRGDDACMLLEGVR